ncbi:MAG: polysaccharide biosynthesis/export family protein [Planctomycetota bacterium]|nr:polysaccharide biosynthesis/export family protein [Planctomycetota bacterium]
MNTGTGNFEKVVIRVCLLGLTVLMAGCYNADQVKAFLLKPRRPVSGLEYRVYPPDVISVGSLHVPEIQGISQRVRPDGKINLPLLGEISVAGKTPGQIEEDIKKAADDYYEQVDATVQVVGYNSQRFYVFGQVSSPGPISWTGHDTLLDVLSMAQPTSLAWPERIIVVRASKPIYGGSTTRPSVQYSMTGVHPPDKDNPRYKMTINLMAMVESGDLANNILLMPNDIIYVQPNPFARIALAIETFFSPIRAAGDGLGDYRELVRQARWIDDGQPRDEGGGRETLIVR